MTQDDSTVNRARRAVRGVTQRAADVAGTLTGKSLEDSIQEYTDVYSQVLTGVTNDLEREKSRNVDLSSRIDRLSEDLALLQSRTADPSDETAVNQARQSRIALWLGGGAIVMAASALMGVVWTAA